MRLVLDHHFGPGTMLSVELLDANQSIGRELPVRVIHAHAPGTEPDDIAWLAVPSRIPYPASRIPHPE